MSLEAVEVGAGGVRRTPTPAPTPTPNSLVRESIVLLAAGATGWLTSETFGGNTGEGGELASSLQSKLRRPFFLSGDSRQNKWNKH